MMLRHITNISSLRSQTCDLLVSTTEKVSLHQGTKIFQSHTVFISELVSQVETT